MLILLDRSFSVRLVLVWKHKGIVQIGTEVSYILEVLNLGHREDSIMEMSIWVLGSTISVWYRPYKQCVWHREDNIWRDFSTTNVDASFAMFSCLRVTFRILLCKSSFTFLKEMRFIMLTEEDSTCCFV